MRALIFAGGAMDPEDAALGETDMVICADGGTRHAVARGLLPHTVIGDLDSLPPGLRGELEARGTRFVVHPRSKDETDLELALLYATEQGADEIVILGARGGRVDHELGNLLLLAHPRLRGVNVRLRTRTQEIFLLRDQAVLRGEAGDLLSLIPIGGDAGGGTTKGLQYSLSDETLTFGPARGMSNVFVCAHPEVRVRQGMLLVVHTRRHGAQT